MHFQKSFVFLAFTASLAFAQGADVGTASVSSRADSGWLAKSWTLEAGYSSGIQWGDLMDAENDMADRAGIRVASNGMQSGASLILLQEYTLDFGLWKTVARRTDVGVVYSHGWTLAVGGQAGLDVLASSNRLSIQGRHWFFRHRNFELGLYGASGGSFGTFHPYPLLEIDGEGMASRVDASGWHLAAGPAMEVKILPQLVLGGVIRLTRESWSLERDAAKSVWYPVSPVSWAIGTDLHMGYRF